MPRRRTSRPAGRAPARSEPAARGESAAPPPKTTAACPIVGLGASAGGLEALEAFFRAMPPDNGLAFAVVQHRSPDRKSLMPELLARWTTMPVVEVQDEVTPEPNHVYVSPSNATFLVHDCRLRPSRPQDSSGYRSLIDQFFASLAEDQGDNAVCIVLSGTGSDGTLGLKAIREHGGTAIVQAVESARWDGMPASAITAGLVDYVLSVEQMPGWLAEHVRYLRDIHAACAPEEPAADAQLRKICSILQRRTGNDFSRYKPSTLRRRVQRRVQLLHATGTVQYLARLREDVQEVDELFKDLLIGVTQFFRDDTAFEAVGRQVIPELLRGRTLDEPVRVWVPGCATGEEAYSLAILLKEQLAKLDSSPELQVFATDIDTQALDVARQGRYPASIAEQVPAKRLARYFVKQKETYQVAKEIRDICTFSVHNLIRDPPFSRLDLLSCRNLLIYMDGELQKKVMPIFHYALRAGGYLFLGPSENMAGHPGLFRTVDKKARIFQSKRATTRRAVHFPLVEPVRSARTLMAAAPRTSDDAVAEVLGRVLSEEYAPPAVAITEAGDIVYFSGQTSPYLETPSGTPTSSIFGLARKGLRLELRTAVYRAIKTGHTHIQPNVVIGEGAELRRVNIIVRPLPELEDDAKRFLVVFQPQEAVVAPARRKGRSAEEPLAQQLDKELRTTRAHLQTMIEELETSNEQLKLSNDDLLSMNQELQSANEELQTSKEELQSVNEEMETVNSELNKKVEELDAAHSDLQNLLKSTEIAVVFLDNELRIRRFTPASTAVFRLIESDVGRPISDIAMPFAGADLVSDARDVLTRLESRERQVRLRDGLGWYILRVLPYRTVNNVIDGVVITLLDVTELRRAQEQRGRLAAIVDSSNDAIVSRDLDGVIASWNAGAQKLFGYAAAEVVGRPATVLVPEDQRTQLQEYEARIRRAEPVPAFESVRLRRDGTRIDVSLTVSPIFDEDGQLSGISAITQDVSARKQAEEARRRSEQVLADFFENAAVGLCWVGPDGTILRANRAELQMLGYAADEYVGRNAGAFHVDAPASEDILARLLRGETIRDYEARLRRRDGSTRHVLIDANVLWEAGRFVHARCFTRDVTDQKRAEVGLRFLLEASQILSSSLDYDAILRAAAKLAVGTLADGAFVDVLRDGRLERSAAEHADPDRLAALDWLARKYQAPADSPWGPPQVARTGTAELHAPLSEEHLAAQAQDNEHLVLLRRVGARASLCVPIRAGERVIGAISLLLHGGERTFGPSEVALAEDLGRRTGIALENARLYGEAQAASQVRDEFLATLSHELRTPLNAIVGWAELLRQGVLDAGTTARAVATIRRNATLQTQLISDILDVSRIIAGKLRLTNSDLDLARLVAEAVDTARPAAGAKGIELVPFLSDEPVLFWGDPARLQQIVGNLLSNGVRFVPAGGHVEIRLRPSSSFVELVVFDDGPGIRPEQLPHIFERFRQDAKAFRHGGLGLGLAIVKHLVELHGGTIDAENRREGRGAVFTIRLPRRRPAVVESGLTGGGATAETPEQLPSLKGTRVLVVDDEPDALEIVRVVLERCGAEVTAVPSADEALVALERDRPHVLVSDIQMPDRDGYELMRIVRALPPDRGGLTPAIALTAYASAEDRVRAMNAGFELHVPKPVQPQFLAVSVGQLAGVLRS